MYVAALEASNLDCFRSLSLEFSRGINLLIGPNNSGKSTVLRCIWNIQKRTIDETNLRLRESHFRVKLSLKDVPRYKLSERLGSASGTNDPVISEMQIDSWYPGRKEGLLERTHFPTNANQQFERFSAMQPMNAIFPYISERRVHQYIEAFTHGYAHSAEGHLATLYPKIARICTSTQLRPLYEKYCRDALGFVVTPMAVEQGMRAGLEVDAIKQEFIPLTRMGAGVINAIGIIVELLVGEQQIFVIEELENDMHPLALRRLSDLIKQSVATGNQFFMSTHSNVLLRELAALRDTRVFEMVRDEAATPPLSEARLLAPERAERVRVLRNLGYELADFESSDFWLILEESSAERIFREFLIPWFAPTLAGRIRTIASQGVDDVVERFHSIQHLLVYLHLEAALKSRVWVWLDGDDAGSRVLDTLLKDFPSWPRDHFSQFSEPSFESFYPAPFQARAKQVLGIHSKDEKRRAKKALLEDVCLFLRSKPEARKELAKSAESVVKLLLDLASKVVS